MSKTSKNDWWCPTCKFTIWGSKPKCFKCGYMNPVKQIDPPKPISIIPIDYWKPGDVDPKWNKYGPYSYLKGGYDGKCLPGEPDNLKFPHCGCNHLMNCPKRHHVSDCNCYTCRCKPHKW